MRDRYPPLRHDFHTLCLPCRPYLHRFARRLTRNETRAEDLTQDVYLKALGSWKQFNPPNDPATSARAWMASMMFRTYLDATKIARRKIGKPAWNILNGTHGRLDESVPEKPYHRMDLMLAADQLTGTFRDMFMMVDVHGMEPVEVARILGIPGSTVRSSLRRARKRLAKLLEGYLC